MEIDYGHEHNVLYFREIIVSLYLQMVVKMQYLRSSRWLFLSSSRLPMAIQETPHRRAGEDGGSMSLTATTLVLLCCSTLLSTLPSLADASVIRQENWRNNHPTTTPHNPFIITGDTTAAAADHSSDRDNSPPLAASAQPPSFHLPSHSIISHSPNSDNSLYDATKQQQLGDTSQYSVVRTNGGDNSNKDINRVDHSRDSGLSVPKYSSSSDNLQRHNEPPLLSDVSGDRADSSSSSTSINTMHSSMGAQHSTYNSLYKSSISNNLRHSSSKSTSSMNALRRTRRSIVQGNVSGNSHDDGAPTHGSHSSASDEDSQEHEEEDHSHATGKYWLLLNGTSLWEKISHFSLLKAESQLNIYPGCVLICCCVDCFESRGRSSKSRLTSAVVPCFVINNEIVNKSSNFLLCPNSKTLCECFLNTSNIYYLSLSKLNAALHLTEGSFSSESSKIMKCTESFLFTIKVRIYKFNFEKLIKNIRYNCKATAPSPTSSDAVHQKNTFFALEIMLCFSCMSDTHKPLSHYILILKHLSLRPLLPIPVLEAYRVGVKRTGEYNIFSNGVSSFRSYFTMIVRRLHQHEPSLGIFLLFMGSFRLSMLLDNEVVYCASKSVLTYEFNALTISALAIFHIPHRGHFSMLMHLSRNSAISFKTIPCHSFHDHTVASCNICNHNYIFKRINILIFSSFHFKKCTMSFRSATKSSIFRNSPHVSNLHPLITLYQRSGKRPIISYPLSHEAIPSSPKLSSSPSKLETRNIKLQAQESSQDKFSGVVPRRALLFTPRSGEKLAADLLGRGKLTQSLSFVFMK